MHAHIQNERESLERERVCVFDRTVNNKRNIQKHTTTVLLVLKIRENLFLQRETHQNPAQTNTSLLEKRRRRRALSLSLFFSETFLSAPPPVISI